MKDFNEFKASLTDEVLENLINESILYSKQILDKNYSEDDDPGEKLVEAMRLQNEYYTLALIEKYHNWLNK